MTEPILSLLVLLQVVILLVIIFLYVPWRLKAIFFKHPLLFSLIYVLAVLVAFTVYAWDSFLLTFFVSMSIAPTAWLTLKGFDQDARLESISKTERRLLALLAIFGVTSQLLFFALILLFTQSFSF